MFKELTKLPGLVSRLGGMVAGGFILVMMLTYIVEILGRGLVGWSTLFADEVSGYFLVGIAFVGMAYVFKIGGHIRITTIVSLLPERARSVLDLCATSLALFFFLLFAWAAWDLTAGSFVNSIKANTVLRTPLVIPQGLMLIGTVLVSIHLLSRVLEQVLSMRQEKH